MIPFTENEEQKWKQNTRELLIMQQLNSVCNANGISMIQFFFRFHIINFIKQILQFF